MRRSVQRLTMVVIVALSASAFNCKPKPPVNGPSPVVSSITPSNGLTTGGRQVTIEGSGFSGASATVGGVALTNVTSTATAVTGVTGPRTAGTAIVVVTNSDGKAGTLANAFTFVEPLTAVLDSASYLTQHNVGLNVSGLGSKPGLFQIASFTWTCGQSVAGFESECNKTGPTATLTYRRCGVANRPACLASPPAAQGTNEYTITLTITDTQGGKSIGTAKVTVTNGY